MQIIHRLWVIKKYILIFSVSIKINASHLHVLNGLITVLWAFWEFLIINYLYSVDEVAEYFSEKLHPTPSPFSSCWSLKIQRYFFAFDVFDLPRNLFNYPGLYLRKVSKQIKKWFKFWGWWIFYWNGSKKFKIYEFFCLT